MKGIVLYDREQWPSYQEVPETTHNYSDVEVSLLASALNRRDYYICKGLYPNVITPVVLGSDGVGMLNDKRVLINPGLGWENNSRVQPSNFEVLGMPRNGTFSTSIRIPETSIFSCPEHLTDYEAAALPLAGMTAYRALFTKAKLQKDESVLITGIGGGVALSAAQFAIAAGARVYVTSGDKEKLDKAKAIGVTDGVNYKSENWDKSLKSLVPDGFDVIIDSAGGAPFEKLVKLSASGGRIALYGGTLGKWQNVSPQLIFWRQISIYGSTMASSEEFVEMLELVEQHKIRPIVDTVYPLSDGVQAIQSMSSHNQFGKIVLDHR